MRLQARRLAIVAAFGLLFGCSLLTNLGDLGADASDDVGVTDVASDLDIGDAVVDAPLDAAADVSSSDVMNLLLNPGFEDGSSGCGIDWTNQGANSNITQSVVAHDGVVSCLVCEINSPGSYYVRPLLSVSVEAGGQYSFAAWIHAAPVDAAIAQTVKISIRPMDDGGALIDGAIAQSAAIAAPQQWQLISIADVVMDPASVSTQVFFVSNDDAGGPSCFLVDDVAMYQQ